VKFKVKGGRERTLPLPDDVRQAIKESLKLDEKRRRNLHSDGENAFLFQPLVNYRTLEFNKALSTRMVRNIVARWGKWCGLKMCHPCSRWVDLFLRLVCEICAGESIWFGGFSSSPSIQTNRSVRKSPR
jgi:hypothetical protein